MREVLQHRYKELQTPIPVTQEQHHSNQIYYSHHGTGKVVGHMEDLQGDKEVIFRLKGWIYISSHSLRIKKQRG